ncbi:permease [Halogeometricum borinquense DSM 11551]|uniref:Permease n=2 Tax=Halogeometricum borinquense TaxID=60847 RepID=E4NSH3_HALBP|nr:AI-2E family transporter [Halogeometricum borinquense]ADQ66962.1 predicted permease [Halogeometricum borinquense DSM 11551]ELY30043.1 permease [Halogeometricum borinquense DSM 11551]RYJ14068.1 AI-2E family transporter [Halogeometricum borinquense]
MPLLDMDRSRMVWWAIGLVLAAALAYVFYSFVGTFVFGIFIYYSTRPIYRRIKRRVRPPSLAAAVALFALALPALALIAYALAIVVNELVRLTNNGFFDLSRYPITSDQLARLTDPNTILSLELSSLTESELSQILSSIGSAADTLAFLGVGGVHLFVMIALAFYLLRDDHRFARWVRMNFADDRGVMEAYCTAVDRDFKNIFFGNILNAVLTGTIGVIAYTVLNMVGPDGVYIPAAALVGLLAGVASLIPVVGMKLVYIPVAIYLAGVSYFSNPGAFWFVIAFIAVSFVIVDTIPDLVLRPYVSGRTLHVGAVMIAYTFGPLLFGWYGIFFAPMILVLVVNFAKYVLPELVTGTPIQPYAVDPATVEDDSELVDRSVQSDVAGADEMPAADDDAVSDVTSEASAETSNRADDGPSAS